MVHVLVPTKDLLAALRSCTKSKDLKKGKELHAAAVESGHGRNPIVTSTIITMYARCASLGAARDVFYAVQEPGLQSWNALLFGYAENGQGTGVLELFQQMLLGGCWPDAMTLIAVLKACSVLADEGAIQKGMALHNLIFTRQSYCSYIPLLNSLISMYSKCKSMQKSRRVFQEMRQTDVVSWNVIMFGYAGNGDGRAVLDLFSCMDCGRHFLAFVVAFKACSMLAAREKATQAEFLGRGMAIHSLLSTRLMLETRLANSMIDMYAKTGNLRYARRILGSTLDKDTVSWNSLMLGYVEAGEANEALNLFLSLICEPDALTYVAALKACIVLAKSENEGDRMESLKKFKVIESLLVNATCGSDIRVANTLTHWFSACGRMRDAQENFNKMRQRTAVSWNALMFGYVENGDGQSALECFSRMNHESCEPDNLSFIAASKACSVLAAQEEGKQVEGRHVKLESLNSGRTVHKQALRRNFGTDIHLGSSLVQMYVRCGSLTEARKVFEGMQDRDAVCWTVLIAGYAENGEAAAALELFFKMGEHQQPGRETYVAALKACGILAALDCGRSIHEDVRRRQLEEDMLVGTALVDFYCKCGSLFEAQNVFDGLATRDYVAWTALMTGYSRAGDTDRVFDLFRRMQEEHTQPDRVTFLCILTACNHAGLVEAAKDYFGLMTSKFGVTPDIEHFHCLLDMLGRTNHVDDAISLLQSMPFKASVVTRSILVAACQHARKCRAWQVVV